MKSLTYLLKHPPLTPYPARFVRDMYVELDQLYYQISQPILEDLRGRV